MHVKITQLWKTIVFLGIKARAATYNGKGKFVIKGDGFMYKKYTIALSLGSFVVFSALFCVRGIQLNKALAEQILVPVTNSEVNEYSIKEHNYIGQAVASGQRIVDYEIIENKWIYPLSEEDYEVLLRIVEAEAGGEGEKGKLLVANVVLNRMNSKDFPDTVKDVVFQRSGQTYQFSPISDGRYYTVEITKETVRAVERALMGVDYSEGALFFAARKSADPERMKWFDENLVFLFSYGGHEFFK